MEQRDHEGEAGGDKSARGRDLVLTVLIVCFRNVVILLIV